MSLGTSIAYLSSIALLVLASKDSSDTTSIEALTRQKTADTISEIQADGGVSRIGKVPVDQLEVGDRVTVPLGAPTDGIIIDGATYFDESSLTGEARPVYKTTGDQMFGGTINKGQVIIVCVTGGSTYRPVVFC